MRAALIATQDRLRQIGRGLTHLDGVAGVATVAAGTYLVAGLGISLIVLGGVLLFSSWARR